MNVSSATVKSSVGGIDVNSLQGSDMLYSEIPVISSLTLKSLPANIHAIPLNISTHDLRKEKILESKVDECTSSSQQNSSVQPPIDNFELKTTSPDISTKVTTNQKHVTLETVSGQVQTNHYQPTTIPFNIPMDLLNQIANGEIMLHSLPNKSMDPSMTTLAGIKTEMGTIPIIPVTGEGGLQLIPLENGSRPIESNVQKIDEPPVVASSAALTPPFLQNSTIRSPVFVPNQAKYLLQIHAAMQGGAYNASGNSGAFVGHPQAAQIAAATVPTSTIVSSPSGILFD